MLAITTICQARPNLTTPTCNCDLPAPKQLNAVEVGTTYATLRWDPVAGAVGYEVRLLDDLGNLIHSSLTTETTILEEDLEPGLAYNYRVAAICLGGGVSTWFSIVPFKPVVVDLVVSLEKPKGGGVIICQKDIIPSAECTFTVQNNQQFLGEIKRKSTGEIALFQLNFSVIGNNIIQNIKLSKVNESYYFENAFPNLKLISNYGNEEDKKIQYAYFTINNFYRLCYIRLDQPDPLKNNITAIIYNPKFEDLEFKIKGVLNNNNFTTNEDRELEDNDLVRIFPNPSVGYININLPQDQNLINCTIFNNLGIKVLSQSITKEENTINANSLPPGIYHVSISFNNSNKMFKFIKL
jgi:hypothetical protein